MIDNPRRQLLLILVVAIAAVIGAFGEPRWGLDLAGGTVLDYDVPVAETAGPDADVDRVMADTVRVLGDRLDPQGILDVSVVRRGETGLQIELPARAGQDLQTIEDRIQNLGRLEMRVLATEGYVGPGGVVFDMAEEKLRLEAWLGGEGSLRWGSVAENPTAIEEYNVRAGSGEGFGLSEELRWYPRVVRPSTRDHTKWDYASARDPTSTDFAVAVFTDGQWNAGPTGEGAPEFLVELLPVNMNERFFSGENLDASGIHPALDDRGLPAVGYLIKPTDQDDYAEWSKKYIGEKSAIILDGVVQSAPTFLGRILGSGIIQGGFTIKDVDELVSVLRSGSLEVKPILQARTTIGASLGEASIKRGLLSIVVGGALVLVFILFYYRLAGIVALCGIALNVLLIWGVLQFLQATLTLPGIAGMVLTMGMAVDANILIYERIREELARGKALVQAIRTGFRRAMVTILDANITTFTAGVVLYNMGVGPIRGFAVTLMLGILTTLFTAFFVSRMVFHLLVVRDVLREFVVRDRFGSLGLDLLRYGKPALAMSLVLILSGLIYAFGFVPRDKLVGLEFTGGASLQVVVQDPMTAPALRSLLRTEESTVLSSVVVNPVGQPDVQNRYRQFNVKLKLNEEQREAISGERRRATIDGEDYTPPYVADLERVLAGYLVEPAYSDPQVHPGTRSRAFASLNLHFASRVSQVRILEALREGNLPGVQVDPATPGATEDLDWLVQWDVASDTRETELFGMVRQRLAGLTDANGNPVLLSNPFPDPEEIGGRMAVELRSAAIGAMIVSLFLIVMYIRIRFRAYRYGWAAVAALVHDVLISFGILAFCNGVGIVSAELNLAMIAAFLTIIGYSINDTIVIFDRIRENLSDRDRLGESTETLRELINRSINQTLSRTILTSGTTLFVVLAQFAVNYGSGSALEGFSFALILGIITGTYSTIFIASPLVLWLSEREADRSGELQLPPNHEGSHLRGVCPAPDHPERARPGP